MHELHKIEEYLLFYVRPGTPAQHLASLVLDRDKDNLAVEFLRPSKSLSEADLGNISSIAVQILSTASRFCGGAACLRELKQELPQCFFLSQGQMPVTLELPGDESRENGVPVLDSSVRGAQPARFRAKRADILIPCISRKKALVAASLTATALVSLAYTITRQRASEEVKMESDLKANVRMHVPGTNQIPLPAVAKPEPVIVSKVHTVSQQRRMRRPRFKSRAKPVTLTRHYWPTSVPQPVPEVHLLSPPDLQIKQAKVRFPIVSPIQEVPPAPDRHFGRKVVHALALPLKKLGSWLQ